MLASSDGETSESCVRTVGCYATFCQVAGLRLPSQTRTFEERKENFTGTPKGVRHDGKGQAKH